MSNSNVLSIMPCKTPQTSLQGQTEHLLTAEPNSYHTKTRRRACDNTWNNDIPCSSRQNRELFHPAHQDTLPLVMLMCMTNVL